MKKILMTILLAAPGLFAQKMEFNLDHLVAKAKEHTVVDLDAAQIKQAMAMAPKEVKEKLAKEKLDLDVSELNAVQVRTFEFEKEGAYTQADLDPIRKQFAAPGWSKIISVKDKDETVDVFMLTQEGKGGGFGVIAAEPKELTVVHISGKVAMNKLQALVESKIAYDLASLTQKSEK